MRILSSSWLKSLAHIVEKVTEGSGASRKPQTRARWAREKSARQPGDLGVTDEDMLKPTSHGTDVCFDCCGLEGRMDRRWGFM